jgi:hypothetical protein
MKRRWDSVPDSSIRIETAIEVLVEREEPTVRDDGGVVAFLPKRFALLQIETEVLACCANVVHGAIEAGTFRVAEIGANLTVKHAELLVSADGHDILHVVRAEPKTMTLCRHGRTWADMQHSRMLSRSRFDPDPASGNLIVWTPYPIPLASMPPT